MGEGEGVGLGNGEGEGRGDGEGEGRGEAGRFGVEDKWGEGKKRKQRKKRESEGWSFIFTLGNTHPDLHPSPFSHKKKENQKVVLLKLS